MSCHPSYALPLQVVMAFWKCLGTDLEEHAAVDEAEWEDDSSKQ